MTRLAFAFIVGWVAVQTAAGQSRIVYTLELGGDNHADLWEANEQPAFTPGTTSGVVLVGADGDYDLTWAVRVSVGGVHVGEPGDGLVPYGAANLVFDLELYREGTLVDTIGAAPLELEAGQNLPTGPGFWSSINDGDAGGLRGGGGLNPDLLANGAFATSIHNEDPAGPPPGQLFRVIDPAPGGPNLDYGWYPASNGRSGTDLGGTHPVIPILDPALGGKLVGFGVGYRSYEYTSYRPGVGLAYLDAEDHYGFGAFTDRSGLTDPLAPPAGVVERALFEGQLSTRGMPWGVYTLKVVPSQLGNNVLHGEVVWDSTTPDYGGHGSFAARANEVYPIDSTDANNPGMQFEIVSCLCTYPMTRRIFYNQSYYDGDNAGIDGAVVPGDHNDDLDAIDPSKQPLLPGDGIATFQNWTGYDKGINGLVYDICYPTRPPVPSDFQFRNIGKAGTSLGVMVAPVGFVVSPGQCGAQRVVITFANGSITDTWLQVTIGTGFGLSAPDVHYWGNAVADSGQSNSPPYIMVNATDEIGARNHPRSVFNRAPVDYPWDYNKDSLVNATDQIIARNHVTSPFNCLRMITK